MKVARYVGNGQVAIVDETAPSCPPGGLLVRTEACGLCSGELMSWYMDKKIPHVLGHEVAGIVVESQDERFPVGARVFPHHHAPCLRCELCQKGLYVHCPQWKRTKLLPGGMADLFAVGAENLNDTLLVDDLRPIDAALIEPLACVVKSIKISGIGVPPMRITTVPVVSQIEKRQGANLPHWRKDGAIYAVTFRLADSVPSHVRDEWRYERERIEELGPTMSDRERLVTRQALREKVDRFLDSGYGACILGQPQVAETLKNAFEFFNGDRYVLHAWCVMPNHVHVMVEPLAGHELSEILHSWKSFTAKKINALLGRTGEVWQTESYDHLIRDEAEYAHSLDYLLQNPRKAGLSDWPYAGALSHDRDGRDTHRRDADATAAVIGLGVMGLMHALLLGEGAVAYDLNPDRIAWARSQGIDARHPDEAEEADVVFVCPGSQAAFDFALRLAAPGATIVMFAPLGPGESLSVPQEAYFRDLSIRNSYSCGPDDTRAAADAIRAGTLRAEQVVSHFIGMEELPEAYGRMKRGEILKPMVVWT